MANIGINYITVDDLIKEHPYLEKDRKNLEDIAKRKTGTCEACGDEEWKYAESGMCFTCTTGESDASEDYELI